MGCKRSLAIGLIGCVLGASMACADRAPVRVIPGRPGVPVVINGYDASYTIVEGDWGLSRPGHVPQSIVSGPLIGPAPYRASPYFPSGGGRPGYGRREVEPPPDRQLPPPAPSYYREWGTQSPAMPATLDPPAEPPPIITAPTIVIPDHRLHRDHRGRIQRHYRHQP
ncbi:hypothetical protein [Bradyrhizobium sp.]|uniref:hypothetical protein n=1 Tax=Bradyrhizobium sp. TaxID=376 RepID=UPI0025C3AA94|nr:hypothetical protein [Bradyrhizobium sp.]